ADYGPVAGFDNIQASAYNYDGFYRASQVVERQLLDGKSDR
ncbi:unnamed protein product, partial [marine sediment metagenome]